MDHVIVDLVSNLVGEMRRPIRQAFARECVSPWRGEKRRQYGRGKYRDGTFHLLSLLVINLDWICAARIRVDSKKMRNFLSGVELFTSCVASHIR